MCYTVQIDKIVNLVQNFNPGLIVVNGVPASGKQHLTGMLNHDNDYITIKYAGDWNDIRFKLGKFYSYKNIILHGFFSDIDELVKNLDDYIYTYIYIYPADEKYFARFFDKYSDDNALKTISPAITKLPGFTEIILANQQKELKSRMIKLCKYLYNTSIDIFDSKFVVVKN